MARHARRAHLYRHVARHLFRPWHAGYRLRDHRRRRLESSQASACTFSTSALTTVALVALAAATGIPEVVDIERAAAPAAAGSAQPATSRAACVASNAASREASSCKSGRTSIFHARNRPRSRIGIGADRTLCLAAVYDASP
jgi:hypothetical protein